MAGMAVPKYLIKHTGSQLKTLAFLLGLPTTGLKADLQHILSRRLAEPPARSEFRKILSIDMGIRNLGVCVLSAPHLVRTGEATATTHTPFSHGHPTLLTISAWEKVDVLKQLKLKRELDFSDSDYAVTERRELERIRERGRENSTALLAGDFTPQNLSEAAYSLVTSLLLTHQPTAIIIERQRFRSGGGSAVQEWTLRVNLLEHMIWACLATLRAQSRLAGRTRGGGAILEGAARLQAVYEVSPAKVAKFWCGDLARDLGDGEDVSSEGGTVNGTRTKTPITKITKADKVAVAKGWVGDWSSEVVRTDGSVGLEFEVGAAQTAQAFLASASGQRKARKKKGKDIVEGEGEESLGKLDDLADCLLQGVAWVKWEENRRRLAQIVD